MEKIRYSNRVSVYMENLIAILFHKHYFSYPESAKQYVENIKDDIARHIAIKQHKPTPRSLSKYGRYYANFRANKHTVWYVIFDHVDDIYNINYITNNHVAKAAELRGMR